MPGTAELKRSLSLPLITFYGLGTILGAGIYVLVGKVAGYAGLYAPIAFLVAAVLTILTGLTYAELSARFPRSAGSALYVQEGFNQRPLSILTGWLIILTGIVSSATLANGFVGYLQVFVAVPDWLVIAIVVLALGALAAWGIAESVMAASVVTVIEIGGLLFILAIAGDSLTTLPARLPELVPPADTFVWQGILLGAFLAFYAFIGFEDMVTVAEEVKDPLGVINVFLLVIGCFLPPVAIILMTAPILYPIVVQSGFDPYWFAVILTINMEIGLITPPVGLNLFVINGIAPDVKLPTILRGALPFVLLMALGIVVLCVFPGIATWLPDTLLGPATLAK